MRQKLSKNEIFSEVNSAPQRALEHELYLGVCPALRPAIITPAAPAQERDV